MSTAKQRSGLRGVAKLRRQLRRLPDFVTEDAREAISDAAELVKFEQLQRVPVEEGDLAASIEIKLGRDKLSAEIGPGARTKTARRRGGWRAHFAEFGTVTAPAHPFVFPALESNRKLIIAIIESGVDSTLRRASNL